MAHRGPPDPPPQPLRNAILFDAVNVGRRSAADRTTETNPAASARHSLVVRLIVRRLLHLRRDPTEPNTRRCIHAGTSAGTSLSYQSSSFPFLLSCSRTRRKTRTLSQDSATSLLTNSAAIEHFPRSCTVSPDFAKLARPGREQPLERG